MAKKKVKIEEHGAMRGPGLPFENPIRRKISWQHHKQRAASERAEYFRRIVECRRCDG